MREYGAGSRGGTRGFIEAALERQIDAATAARREQRRLEEIGVPATNTMAEAARDREASAEESATALRQLFRRMESAAASRDQFLEARITR